MHVNAQNRSLDNDYGSTHGPNSPASFTLGLFTGDPLADGEEVTDTTEVDTLDADGNVTGTEEVANGYARAAVAHSDFLPAADGVKTSDPVGFPDTLAEWPDTVTHWQLFDASTGEAWDSGELVDGGLEVSGPGSGPTVALSIFYADSVQEDATV